MSELISCQFENERVEISRAIENYDEQHCFSCPHLEICRTEKEKII